MTKTHFGFQTVPEEEKSSGNFSDELYHKEEVFFEVMNSDVFRKNLKVLEDSMILREKFNVEILITLRSITIKKIEGAGEKFADAYAIMTTQIIPRYLMLLNELLKDINKLKAVNYIDNKIGNLFSERAKFFSDLLLLINAKMKVENDKRIPIIARQNKLTVARIKGIIAEGIDTVYSKVPNLKLLDDKLFVDEMTATLDIVTAKESAIGGLSPDLVSVNFYKAFISVYVNAVLNEKYDDNSLKSIRQFLRFVDRELNKLNVSGLVFNNYMPYEKDFDSDHFSLDGRILSAVSPVELDGLIQYLFDRAISLVRKDNANDSDRNKFIDTVVVVSRMGENACRIWDKLFKDLFPNSKLIVGDSREKLAIAYGLLSKQPRSNIGHNLKLIKIINEDFRNYLNETGKSLQDIDAVVDDLRSINDFTVLKNKVKEFIIWNEMKEYVSGRTFSIIGTEKNKNLAVLEDLIVKIDLALESSGEIPLIADSKTFKDSNKHKERVFFTASLSLPDHSFKELLLGLHSYAQEIHRDLEVAKDMEKMALNNGNKPNIKKATDVRVKIEENVLGQLTNILKIIERTSWDHKDNTKDANRGKKKWNEIVGKDSIFYIKNLDKKLSEDEIKKSLKTNINSVSPRFEMSPRSSIVNLGFLSEKNASPREEKKEFSPKSSSPSYDSGGSNGSSPSHRRSSN